MTDFSEIYNAAPDAAIKAKLDEHIRQILSKPAISKEDYAILREKLAEVDKGGLANAGALLPLMLMPFMFGGGK